MTAYAMNGDVRIPFFRYVDREHGVDAEKSKEAGYEVPKMITFIQITPHGHRGDPMEFFADDFIERKTQESRDNRFDPRWVAEMREALTEWRNGKELPRTGTPLMLWERILKSRREQLAARFPTLEDLAACPDSGLGLIGLDGRVLRDMAAAEMQAKKDLSPIVKELADAKEENRRLTERLDSVLKRLEALEIANDNRRGRASNG